MYEANFGSDDFHLGDVRDIAGADIPDVEVATASFPCTDLSLAGRREGLGGEQSSMFWEFARVLDEMGSRRPQAILLENVPSFASSRGGDDLQDALGRLSHLGYVSEVLRLDARHFVPQSRDRLFVCARRDDDRQHDEWQLAFRKPASAVIPETLQPPPLDDLIEDLPAGAPDWWDEERAQRLVDSLSETQRDRFDARRVAEEIRWTTAYRRTRSGRAVWELRRDRISGCLRTARGGSSKQALVQVGRGEFRVRWIDSQRVRSIAGRSRLLHPRHRDQEPGSLRLW